MDILKKRQDTAAVIGLILLAILFRLIVYGDPRLAIAREDTDSYIEASRPSLLSWESWSGRRLFTTNLIYKIYTPAGNYPILRNGSTDTGFRQIKPGFQSIAATQWIISAMSWSLLAMVFSHYIKNRSLKIFSSVMILVFAMLPQNADWESVMGAESLSMSFLVLQFAFLTVLAFKIHQDPGLKSSVILLAGITGIAFFLWAFTRDANIYAALVYLILLLPLLKSSKFQNVRKLVIAAMTLVVGVLIIGAASSARSTRAIIQLDNVYRSNIYPNAAAVEYMQSLGMPRPDSTGFSEWFKQNAAASYFKFLITHPGYTTGLLYHDTLVSFSSSLQPYFQTPRHDFRNRLIVFGDLLHSRSSTPLLFSIMLLAGLWLVAFQNRVLSGYPWAWLATWLFLVAMVTLAVSVLGDVVAINRHAIMSTAALRLYTWVFSIVMIDLALTRE